jgi:hypothetical protein
MAHSCMKYIIETVGSLLDSHVPFVNWEHINLQKITVLKKEHQCIYIRGTYILAGYQSKCIVHYVSTASTVSTQ